MEVTDLDPLPLRASYKTLKGYMAACTRWIERERCRRMCEAWGVRFMAAAMYPEYARETEETLKTMVTPPKPVGRSKPSLWLLSAVRYLKDEMKLEWWQIEKYLAYEGIILTRRQLIIHLQNARKHHIDFDYCCRMLGMSEAQVSELDKNRPPEMKAREEFLKMIVSEPKRGKVKKSSPIPAAPPVHPDLKP
jgi:hypothetical protein